MSSILRALKKLEKEPRHLDESQPLESKFVPLADTDGKNPTSRIILMVLGGGIVSGIVILAGWWLLAGKSPQPSPVSGPQIIEQTVSGQEITLQSSGEDISGAPAEGVVPENGEVSRTVVTAQENAAKPEETGTPGPESEALPANIPEAVPATSADMETEAEPPGQLPETSDSETAGQKASPVEEADDASPYIPQQPAEAQEIAIPKLNDPDLKLQAITWSKIPEKRITVINNRILHEGETVSGYIIDNINQDDVVLSRNGIKGRLLFR